MITIELDDIEYYDGEEFHTEIGGVVDFEYSLKAVYDWESKWLKPFLKGELTEQELLDFYKMMANRPIDEKYLTVDVTRTLADYIKDTSTATTFSTNQNGQNPKKLSNKPKNYTAEELYALMFSSGIPLEFENRNLNRLLIILRIIGSYNSPPTKMSKQDIFKQNSSINAQRKSQLQTKG